MDIRAGSTRLARDHRSAIDLCESIYGALPSCAPGPASADLRAASIPAKRFQDSKWSKRKAVEDSSERNIPGLSVSNYNGRGYRITAQTGGKRGRLQTAPHKMSHMDDAHMHQSTLLNLSTDPGTNSNESDLWILPDFDEWEMDAESPQQAEPPTKRRDSDWAPLLERAVNSNRERLRRRLEGDGWDFVGGKYGEDGQGMKEMDCASEESVDEEFDVVVLPVVQVAC